MEPWRTTLLIATVVGFVVTVAGLWAAYKAAAREHRESVARIGLMREISDREDAAQDAIPHGPERESQADAVRSEYDRQYALHGLLRPTYENIDTLALHETQRLLGMVLQETRRDFVIAGVGLLISTIASGASLFLPGQ